MKKKSLLIAVLIWLVPLVSRAHNAELKIEQSQLGDKVTCTLHVYTDNVSWTWHNAGGGQGWVIEHGPYSETFNAISFTFDAPKSAGEGFEGTLPWGLVHFELSGPEASIFFTIDFRDENWSWTSDQTAL